MIFPLWKTFDVLNLKTLNFCGRGKKRFDVFFLRIKSVYFLLKGGDDAACEEENGGKMFNSRQSRHFLFVDSITKVLLPTFFLTWHVNNYVSRQGKSINGRNGSTKKEDPSYYSNNQLTVQIVTKF